MSVDAKLDKTQQDQPAVEYIDDSQKIGEVELPPERALSAAHKASAKIEANIISRVTIRFSLTLRLKAALVVPRLGVASISREEMLNAQTSEQSQPCEASQLKINRRGNRFRPQFNFSGASTSALAGL